MKYIEDPRLLELRFSNGMLILPWYYSAIMGYINQAKFSGQDIPPAPIFKRFWNILKEVGHLSVKKKDVLIFTSTLFNSKNNKGEYFNTLHGYYYEALHDNALMMEDGDKDNNWRKTKLYPNNSHLNSFALFFLRLLSVLANKIKPISRDDYEIITSAYPDIITKESISVNDYYSRFYASFLRWLFKIVSPKVIILNCGTYGNVSSVVCKVAHERGIKVVEPQHGQIFNSVIYSVSTILDTNKEYRLYVPDYLYTFGDYWSNNVGWNYEKIAVGNPYLNDFVKKLTLSSNRKGIIIISQPFKKEYQTPFVKELSKLLPDENITIRLHPVEKLEEEMGEYYDCENIKFSDSTKILYQDMLDHKYVIGWNSTCLFELLAFKKMPFIVDCPMSRGYFPDDVGCWIKSAEEMADIIMRGEQPEPTDCEKFWASDFENTVQSHIIKIIKGET